jgi:hypothetical protein
VYTLVFDGQLENAVTGPPLMVVTVDVVVEVVVVDVVVC